MTPEEETTFYCERAQRNCPIVSKFRYCWDCIFLQELAEDYEEKESKVAGNGKMGS